MRQVQGERAHKGPLTVTALSSSSTTAQVKQRQKQNQVSISIEENHQYQKLQQISRTTDRTWSVELLILAKIIEKRLISEGKSEQISHISEEIRHNLRERNIKIWPHVHDYLPKKYKQDIKDTTSLHHERCDVLTANSSYVQSLRTIPHILKLLPHSEIAEVVSIGKAITREGERISEDFAIALYPDDNDSVIDQTNEGKKQSKKPTTIDKPVPHGTLTRDACYRASKHWKDVGDRVFEFPVEILEQDLDISKGIDTLHELMDPSLDLKYSQDWPGWFETEMNRDIFGKHAAAVMSFSVTNLCANCSDEKTHDWVRMEPVSESNYSSYSCLQCNYQIDTVCPRCNISMKQTEKPCVAWECPNCEGKTPIRRDLTREQVGDKSSIVMEKALEVIEHVPTVMAFCRWYRNWIKLRVYGRKERLSDELSEKA